MMEENPINKNKPQKKIWKILLIIFSSLTFVMILLFVLWVRPTINKPISEPFTLMDPAELPIEVEKIQNTPPTNLSHVPIFPRQTPAPDIKPSCGQDAEWIVLMVGIDYRGDDYMYGLADSIRVVRIDFVNMKVNMIALPRDLIVEAPEGRFTAPDPYKINQAYLFGTPGMGHYLGTGLGAGALAEVIYHNFGVPIDHYGVINFRTLIDFVDAIDGIEVDLPNPVFGGYFGDFPAGKQVLNGERTLALATIREGYSDDFRVRNQTQIIRAVLNKLIKPAYWEQVPKLINEFGTSYLTDLSIEQVANLSVCFLQNFDKKNLQTFEAPEELLTGESAFIPTLNDNAFVYRWDEGLIKWIHESLLQD